jgi:hypothetical protein
LVYHGVIDQSYFLFSGILFFFFLIKAIEKQARILILIFTPSVNRAVRRHQYLVTGIMPKERHIDMSMIA